MAFLLNIFLIIFFILLNGFFVLSEYALVSVRKTRIQVLIKQKNKNAKTLQYALDHLPTYISATQLGITIASIALGWLGEPTLAQLFSTLFPFFLSFPALYAYYHLLAIACALLLITFLEIIFGELAPKTTALQKPEKIAFLIIIPLTVFTVIFKPFILFLEWSAQVILNLFHISMQGERKSIHSEEEIKMILAQSAQGGAIDQHEVDLINRVFAIGDLPIQTIMTPLREVIAFNNNDTVREVAKEITEKNIHAHFPIYETKKDNIIGYVSVIDIYELAKELEKDRILSQTRLVRTIVSIDSQMRIDDVLVFMKTKGIHFGQIIKGKSTIGIISIEDIIESLIGEINEAKE